MRTSKIIKFDKVLSGRYSAPQRTAHSTAPSLQLRNSDGWVRPHVFSFVQAESSLKMTESIGEKLRLARETRGIALRDISEQTRISMRYLEAIETNDYRRLPGGIFNRSFIRAYAKFVGYDEQEAIEEYSRALRQQGEDEEDLPKTHRSLVYTDDTEPRNRSHLTTLLLAILILAILSLVVWAGLHFYQTRFSQNRFETGNTQILSASSRLEVCGPNKEGEHAFFV